MVVDESSDRQARENTVDFFENNSDPFTLMYYVYGYSAAHPADASNVKKLGPRTTLIGLQFNDPLGRPQKPFDEIFAKNGLLKNVKTTASTDFNLPYADAFQLIDSFFPYGERRGFWGPQTTKVTTQFLEAAAAQMEAWIETMVKTGDDVTSSLWALQYMSPGLNGNLPTTAEATAWPHPVAGHQTLFSPGWHFPANDKLVQM